MCEEKKVKRPWLFKDSWQWYIQLGRPACAEQLVAWRPAISGLRVRSPAEDASNVEELNTVYTYYCTRTGTARDVRTSLVIVIAIAAL